MQTKKVCVSLVLRSSKNRVTSPSVKVIFMDWQSLSQVFENPKTIEGPLTILIGEEVTPTSIFAFCAILAGAAQPDRQILVCSRARAPTRYRSQHALESSQRLLCLLAARSILLALVLTHVGS